MDSWAWSDHLAPWLARRVELPVGPLFCVIDGPTRGRPWSATSVRGSCAGTPRPLACDAGSRRTNFVTRTRSSSRASGCRCRSSSVSSGIMRVIVSTTSVYLQGIDVEEIIGTIHARRAPMMHVSAGLEF